MVRGSSNIWQRHMRDVLLMEWKKAFEMCEVLETSGKKSWTERITNEDLPLFDPIAGESQNKN